VTDAPPERLTLDRVPTPIGEALICTDETDALRILYFADHEDHMRLTLSRLYRGIEPVAGAAPARIRQALQAYFSGELQALDRIHWRIGGTDFQRKVWNALAAIPAGETRSYGEQAARIGHPTAVRAVGLANGANPISLVLPCHRVIGSDGSLTGYGGGLERKRWLLAHEGALSAQIPLIPAKAGTRAFS
jgi:methylated-DNA-[protein]-cysteine S-methyltransferase